MIKNILDMLRLQEHYGVSENIEIAKGKYEMAKSIKDAFQKIKRERKWQKR